MGPADRRLIRLIGLPGYPAQRTRIQSGVAWRALATVRRASCHAITRFSHHSGRRTACAQYPHSSARDPADIIVGHLRQHGGGRSAGDSDPCRTSSARVISALDRRNRHTSEKARSVLGWAPRPARETVLDCARSLIAHGIA